MVYQMSIYEDIVLHPLYIPHPMDHREYRRLAFQIFWGEKIIYIGGILLQPRQNRAV